MIDLQDYLRFGIALIVVIGLILLTAAIFRRLGFGAGPIRQKRRRLHIVEMLPLDNRRRLVLIRHDDREHLLILGQQHDTVVEASRPAPADTDLRAEPDTVQPATSNPSPAATDPFPSQGTLPPMAGSPAAMEEENGRFGPRLSRYRPYEGSPDGR